MSEVGSVVGSVVVVVVVLVAAIILLPATWNASRPVIDPTRRYSPMWFPAMIVSELAPLFLVLHAMVIGLGVVLGAGDSRVGSIGLALLAGSSALVLWLLVRTRLAVSVLRRRIHGSIPAGAGRRLLFGLPVPTPAGVREVFGIEWAPGLTADVARPDDDRRALPVCVYVHGGGWTRGDPQRQARDLYHALALDGWVTVAIRYPFAPAASVETQVDTVRRAVAWVRGGFGEHGVDATHVAVAGGSAGGHLAALAALTPGSSDETVDACVPMYAIFDLANRNRTRAPWTIIERTVMQASVAAAPQRYAAMSPLDRITATSPPMLVVHGTRDTLVPIGEAEQFVAALQEAGRPVDFVPVPGAQHAFDGLSSPTSRATAAVIRDWLRSTVLDSSRSDG